MEESECERLAQGGAGCLRAIRELINLPLSAATLARYGGGAGLRRFLQETGCQGFEDIWAGENIPEEFPKELMLGYHLTFTSDWLDFYREDTAAIIEKFGTLTAAREFYGGWGAACLLEMYRADLHRAKTLGAAYVVFHVSDVSIEEGYTYRWWHSHEEVIDAAAEIINSLLTGEESFDFLMENQWWPGFTFTDPALTERLLAAIRYPRKGIMLDTGHLMNTNPGLRTQREGVAYLHRMLDCHGELCRYIRGLHLHQSLSGEYVRRHTGRLPEDLPGEYMERFGVSYRHILQIDQHEPWTVPEATSVVERIKPAYLTHELAAGGPEEKRRTIERQRAALGSGHRVR